MLDVANLDPEATRAELPRIVRFEQLGGGAKANSPDWVSRHYFLAGWLL